MKTQTVETPVQIIHGYVPLIAVDQCPEWAREGVFNQHGSHNTLPDGRCMVLCDGGMRGVPPGAWIVVYRHDDNDGCHDMDLWIAARVR